MVMTLGGDHLAEYTDVELNTVYLRHIMLYTSFPLNKKNIYHFRGISEPQTSYQQLYTYGIGRAISSQAYGREIGKGIKFRGKLMETEASGLRAAALLGLSLMLLESGWPQNHLGTFGITYLELTLINSEALASGETPILRGF